MNFNYLLTISMIMISIITLMTMKLAMIFSKKNMIKFEKMSPFECGFNPITNTRLPFSTRFFMITIIFLIFDIEIALLLPLIYTFKYSNIITWVITSISFLLILIIGLFHEWNQGALNWL